MTQAGDRDELGDALEKSEDDGLKEGQHVVNLLDAPVSDMSQSHGR